MARNYFLLLVTRHCVKENELNPRASVEYYEGDTGVGRTNMEPSISEYPVDEDPFGIFYIAPESWVQARAARRNWSPYALTPTQIKTLVLEYWNHNQS